MLLHSIFYLLNSLLHLNSAKVLKKKKHPQNLEKLPLFRIHFQVNQDQISVSLNRTKITAASKVCVSELQHLSKGIILLRRKIFIFAKIPTSSNIHTHVKRMHHFKAKCTASTTFFILNFLTQRLECQSLHWNSQKGIKNH